MNWNILGKFRRERRLNHLCIALAVAGACIISILMLPFDFATWAIQTKLGQNDMSGDIVFVEVGKDIAIDPSESIKVTKAIEYLERNGAQAIFLDTATGVNSQVKSNLLPLSRSGSDTQIFAVGRFFRAGEESVLRFPSGDRIRETQKVVVKHETDMFGYVWQAPALINVENVEFRSFSSVLFGREGGTPSPAYIDYRFAVDDVPVLDLSELASKAINNEQIADKSFVMGFGKGSGDGVVRMPGYGAVPASYIPIMSAETLRSGVVAFVPAFTLLIAVAFGLLAAISQRGMRRRWCYGVVTSIVIFSLILPIILPLRVESGASIILLAVFFGLRSVRRWRGKIELESAQTGLPSLSKLEKDFAEHAELRQMSLIAMKVHGLVDILAAMKSEYRREFFQIIAARLRVTNQELIVYSDSGEHLLWLEAIESKDILDSHLSALRAIFTNPVTIDDCSFDVPVTLSVDLDYVQSGSHRVGNVIALGESATLAEQPIVFGDSNDDEDREWKVSLQHKIDTALDSGAIFPVFQPKVSLSTGEVTGFEALVRWEDEERGLISPAYFVEKCEQAGRMERLTRHMLEVSLGKFKHSEGFARGCSISVNASATLLSDTRLAEIVEAVLESIDFPEQQLTLEITETAGIHNPATAKSVLMGLASIGVGLSLDDFGTGNAGLETFYLYPFSELKIDRLFTSAIVEDPKALKIVEEIVRLGVNLGMDVVCEGVENAETLELLKAVGCPTAQGYFLGRPTENSIFMMPERSTGTNN